MSYRKCLLHLADVAAEAHKEGGASCRRRGESDRGKVALAEICTALGL